MRPEYRIFVLIILIPLCWLFYNNVANWHYHQDNFGNPVKHSHPYNPVSSADCCESTPAGNNHEHSAKELLLLNMISNAGIIILLALTVFQLTLFKVRVKRPEIEPVLIPVSAHSIPLLRAPPRFV